MVVVDNHANVLPIPFELVGSSKPCPTIGVFLYLGSFPRTISAANGLILSDVTPTINHSMKCAMFPSSCKWETSSSQLEVESGTVSRVTFSSRDVTMPLVAQKGQLASTILSSDMSMLPSFLGLFLLPTGHRFNSRQIPRTHYNVNSQRLHLAAFPVQLMNRLWGMLRSTILPIRILLLHTVIFLPSAGVSALAWIVLLLWDATGRRYPTIKSSGITSIYGLVNTVPSPLRICCFRSRLPWSHHISALQALAGLWLLVCLMESHLVIKANMAATSGFLMVAYYIVVSLLFQNNVTTQRTLQDAATLDFNLLWGYASPNHNHSNNVRGKKSHLQSHSKNNEVVDMETDEVDVEEDMETDASAEDVTGVDYDDTDSMEIDEYAEVVPMEVDFSDCDDAGIALEIDDEDETDMDVDLREDEIMEWEEPWRIRGGWDSTGFEIEPDHIFIRQPLYKTWSCADVKTEPMDWEENITEAGWKWLNFSFTLNEKSVPRPAASSAANIPRKTPYPGSTPPLPTLSPRVDDRVEPNPSLSATTRDRYLTSAGDAKQSERRNHPTQSLGLGGPSALGDHTNTKPTEPCNRGAHSRKRSRHSFSKEAIQGRHSSHKRRQELRHMASRCVLATLEAERAKRGEKVSEGIKLARPRVRQDYETPKLIRALAELGLREYEISSSSDAHLTSKASDRKYVKTTQGLAKCSMKNKPQQGLTMPSNSRQPAPARNIPEEQTRVVDKLDHLHRCSGLMNLANSSSQA